MVIANETVKRLWMPLVGVPMGGLLWSVAAIIINNGQVIDLGMGLPSTLLLVLAGGMAQTVAVWVGFSAILWAMVRGFGQPLSLLQVLRLMSGVCWPLWIGAPAIAFWVAGTEQQTTLAAVISLTSLVGVSTLTGKALAEETGWSTIRAFSALGAAVVFIFSFLYLNI